MKLGEALTTMSNEMTPDRAEDISHGFTHGNFARASGLGSTARRKIDLSPNGKRTRAREGAA